MALTQKQVQDVCFHGGGNQQCRYLDQDITDAGSFVFVCKKKSPEAKIIDDELQDWLVDIKKNGQDPDKQGVSLGDNCQGYIKLITKKQGYDV